MRGETGETGKAGTDREEPRESFAVFVQGGVRRKSFEAAPSQTEISLCPGWSKDGAGYRIG